MAAWWENDVVVNSGASGNWWEKDALANPAEAAREALRAQVRNESANASYLEDPTKPSSFRLLTDLVTDPFGISDELRGLGKASKELVLGRKAQETGKSRWDTAGEEYTREADRARAERDVAREKFGYAPEIIGGFGTMGPAQAAPQAVSWLRGAGQSARAGAGYGAAAGAAQSEGGPTERIIGAGEGGMTGGLLAPAISHVAIPGLIRTGVGVRDAVRYGTRALQSARNPEQAAIENVADRMVATGVDPAAVRAQVSPAMSANLRGRGFSDDDIATIVSRGLSGEPAAQIGRDFGINPSTVTGYVNAYRTANPTPMNIIDVAKDIAGEGGAAPMTRLGRAAYSLAGDESGQAAQRLMGRQEGQAGRVSNIIQRSVAGGDFEATRAAGLANLEREAGQAYRQFYAEPHLAIDQLGDLMEDPLFRRANILAQRQARVETIRRNQNAARTGGRPEPVPEVDPNNQVFSPQQLDLIQRQLRIASEGAIANPNAARHARNLREVFLDRIEDHYPTFRDIRRNYAQGMGEFGEEGALQAGRDLVTRLGANADEALRGFDNYTPAQQELFRLGFARHLMDMAANPQIGGAVANQFNTTAVRQLVERLYPRANRQLYQQGQRLLRDLRREAITTRTKNDVLVGARTAELQSDMGRLMEGAQTAADVATGRWGKLLENLATRLTSQIGRRGAREVLRILTETDPAQVLPLLNRLAQAAQTTAERQAYVTALRELRANAVQGLGAQTGVGSGRHQRVSVQ